MTHDYKKALNVLANHQKWRRGCEETLASHPTELGIAIDSAIEALKFAEKLKEISQWASETDLNDPTTLAKEHVRRIIAGQK